MGDGRRVPKVERELQELIARYLIKGFRYQLRGLVSVSRVESTPKLATATVFVSVLGSPEDQEASLQTLEENIYEIQKFVNSQLRMKHIPRLTIELDRGLQHMMHIGSVLKTIERERKKGADKSEE